MDWWIWFVGGVAIGALEVMLPGYYFVGFMAGGIMTGLVMWSGLFILSLPMQILVFALISLAAWGGLRRALPLQRGEVKRWTRDIND
ncbi:MAG: hypothetical protein LBE86_09925 [Gemmobacter sp.]|jgi:membrane protein implicated in regulation of membrane protease activity|nr:hypothetical protein [Gemmobacter sp.]